MCKLAFFDVYTDRLGWEITPVKPKTKSPILKKWNKSYNKKQIREYLLENPDHNLGLVLGNIIDVEADTEEGNRVLNQILGDYKHPQWRSKRSIHHLFLNLDPRLTKLVIHGIEFRGFGHQSILPPSEVGNYSYRWLNADFPVPPVPKSLLKFYWKYVNRYVRPKYRRKHTTLRPMDNHTAFLGIKPQRA